MREIPRPHQNFFISGYSPVFTGKKNESQIKKIWEMISGNYPLKKIKKKIWNSRASSQPGPITRSRYRWPILL